MRSIKTELIIKTLIGALIGALIGVVIWAMLYVFGVYSDELVLDRIALLAQLAGCVLLGAVNMGGSTIYSIESWSLWKVTLIHYLLSMSSLVAASTVLGWYDLPALLIMLVICTFVYILIWLANYISYKRSVNSINRDLKLMLNKEQEGDHR